MAAGIANRSTFRFPGHPAPVSRGNRLNPWEGAARPLAQATTAPHAGVGTDLFAEVLANIHQIIRGERPVPVHG
ncbi:hypothetical protein [Azospirillum sp. TSO22-1]|uniref:hypothetical protein n=1 Tax=Azospirillum sp. TSO22-1 TaxID=716789 RepID=UPI000D60C39F|nr:hypothetical protein [Azospirillum sp. TSO22-1]PWC32043.1 hypothetical protein TSO221_31730 [Azospirillum sp. TSO22-1]